jgi:ribosomal protein S21
MFFMKNVKTHTHKELARGNKSSVAQVTAQEETEQWNVFPRFTKQRTRPQKLRSHHCNTFLERVSLRQQRKEEAEKKRINGSDYF